VSDSRWADVEGEPAAAARHFAGAVQLYERGGFAGSDLDAYAAQMAFMHAAQSGRTSLESALVRILEILGEERPTGDDWRRDLIRRACRPMPPPNSRPPVLSERVCAAADETRRFRHRAAWNYDTFVATEAAPTVAAARVIAALLLGEIAAFRDAIDPA
jgi:hypothetical protein